MLLRVGRHRSSETLGWQAPMNNLAEFLLISEAAAVAVAAAVVGWHYWRRHNWDAESARLKAKGLPWLVLLVLTMPLVYTVACLAGDRFGRRTGVFALVLLLIIVSYSRRMSAKTRTRNPRNPGADRGTTLN